GHWKRNYLVYLVELLKKKKQVDTARLCSGVCNTHFLNMVPTKKVDKTTYELWYEKVPNVPDLKAEFFEKSLITQEVSGRAIDHEEIQDKDTSPFENTNEISIEVEGFEPPRAEVILVKKQEKDKIRTKPDKNRKRRKAWQCQSPVTVKKAVKIRKYKLKGPNMQILKVVFIQGNSQASLGYDPGKLFATLDLLIRACPHHGFSELHQLDTFYNALNVNDQDSLNFAAGGNIFEKIPSECLKIIESKSKVRKSRAEAVVAKVNMSSSTPAISSDVAELKDM
nr:reverse transcriptase domain-containing protein [Tanacetum cinerariifolium]